MNIGIYGDSFAVKSLNPERKSWVDHFSEHFNVTNYATVGSNLAYSMDKFYRYNNNYHMNVFFVTSFGRIWVEGLKTFTKGLAGLPTVKHALTVCKDEYDLEILRAAHDYYIHVENREHQILMHKALVKDLMTFKNTIIIPCFKHASFVPNWQGATMMHIAELDLKYYDINYMTEDKKPCHINDQNNKIFATKLRQYIQGPKLKPFYINIHDYEYPVGQPIEYNYGEKTDIEM